MSVESALFEGRRKSTAHTKEHDGSDPTIGTTTSSPSVQKSTRRKEDMSEDDDEDNNDKKHHDNHDNVDDDDDDDDNDEMESDDDDDDSGEDHGLEAEADARRASLLGQGRKKGKSKKGKKASSRRRAELADGEVASVSVGSEAGEDEVNIETLDLGLDSLDLTSVDIDYAEMERDFASVKDNVLLREALSSANLRQFTRTVGANLAAAETDTVPAILAQADEFALLYHDLDVCDGVLAQLESMLDGFRANLGGLSDDIQRLQDNSMSKNVALANRRSLHTTLQARLREITLGKHMTRKLQTAPIDDKYLTYLQDLNRKLSFLAHGPDEPAPNRAIADARRTVGEIQNVVVGRLRQHLIGALGQVKSIDQLRGFQRRFNRHGAFYQFLFKHDNPTATTLLSQYIEHGGRTYNVHLSSYLTALLKLMAPPTIGKRDLIGVADDKLKNLFSSKLINLRRETQPFALGDRERIVAHLFDPPHDLSKAAAGEKVPYEEIFRSFFFELTELIANETTFIQDFFLVELEGLHQQVFGRTLEQFMQHLEKYLSSCYDALTILIMLCATGQYKRATNQRMVTILNDYYDRVFTMLMDRFSEIVALNVASIQKATPKNLGLAPGDALPHYVTRRYAEWFSAVAQLAGNMVDDAPVRSACEPLNDAMKDLLQRLSESLNAPLRSVFVINNYSLIVKLLEERKAPPAMLEPPRHALERATRKHARADAAREFGPLIALMNECGYEKATAIRRDHPMAAVASPTPSQPATPIRGSSAAVSGPSDDNADESAAPSTPVAAAPAAPSEVLSPGALESEYIKLLTVPDGITEKRITEVAASFEKDFEVRLNRLRSDTLQHFASFETGMAVFSATLAYIFDLFNSFARMAADKFPKVRCIAPEAVKGIMQGLVMSFLS
jgi:hypothetical protein